MRMRAFALDPWRCKMKYVIHFEPHYEYVCLSILKNIINGRSIKSGIDELLERYGKKYKALCAKLFANALKLEKIVKDQVNLSPALSDQDTPKNIAEFLFKQRGDFEYTFADVYTLYDRLFESGTDYKERSILSVINEDCCIKNFGEDDFPQGITVEEFFSALCACTDNNHDIVDVMRLYFNFEYYKQYVDAIILDAIRIVKDNSKLYEDDAMRHMNYVKECIDRDGAHFLEEKFNVKLDDTGKKDLYDIYPGIYEVATIAMIVTVITRKREENKKLIMGIHIFEMVEKFVEMQSEYDKIEEFLKCISDSTKLGILKSLRESPKYGTQLAEELNCTSANISHHMQPLLRLNILHLEKENNRIYLHLNKEVIGKYLDDAKAIFGAEDILQ